MKTKELAELLERATKNMEYPKATALDWNERAEYAIRLYVLAPDLAAELIRCRELLEQAVYESMGMSFAAKCGPLPFVAEAKKYLSETEG